MSDPQPDRLKPRPRRAEPLQPDKPGSGADAAPTDADPAADAGRAVDAAQPLSEQQKEQLDTAHENVRKGYD